MQKNLEISGLPHKATAQHNLVPAEPVTQSIGTILWLRPDVECRSPRDEASDTGSESARESLDTDEANEALRRDNAWLKKHNHLLTKQVQELERQLADAHVAHATAMDKRGAEIKALKGLLGKP